MDSATNYLFAIDIFVNFISAIDLENGSYEHRIDEIAKNYIKSWFLFDVSSILPVQWVTSLLPTSV